MGHVELRQQRGVGSIRWVCVCEKNEKASVGERERERERERASKRELMCV